MSMNRPDELELARTFVQVVRSGSQSRAARTLGVDASRVSRALAELEEDLGATLLLRTTRRQRLTDAGEVYLLHAERLIEASQAAREAVAELRGGLPRGRLRVSMPVAVGDRMLAPHLPSFHARYPGLRLEIDLSDRNVDLVAGGYDLAIRLGAAPEGYQRVRKLGRVPIVVAASPDYLARSGALHEPADLAAHNLIVVGPGSAVREWPFYRGTERAVVHAEPVVQSSGPNLAAQLAVAGMGIVRLPRWVVRAELASGALLSVLAQWSCDDPRRGGVPLWIVFAQEGGAQVPLKSRVFADWVEALGRQELADALPLGQVPTGTR